MHIVSNYSRFKKWIIKLIKSLDLRKKEMAGVLCDICETEMEIVNPFQIGYVPVKCPNCGHRATYL